MNDGGQRKNMGGRYDYYGYNFIRCFLFVNDISLQAFLSDPELLKSSPFEKFSAVF
jgi:hypothetical protein